jgi:glutamyl-tRNA synthetase
MPRSAQSQLFFALAQALPKSTVVPEIVASLDSLDDHLAFRTFLVGHHIAAADWAVWGAIKGPLRPPA